MSKLPKGAYRQFTVDKSGEEYDKAKALVERNQFLEEYLYSLQPLFRELEVTLGYKEGDAVNSWEFVERGTKFLQQFREVALAALKEREENE